jgi:ubiquinone/menaquinone biosynthesis C-methylase UbiE
MEKQDSYLMEDPQEAVRLVIKTDPEAIKKQAQWCGIGPGARVLDVGCGSGKVTSILHEMVQPGGYVLGVDFSEERIAYAREEFGSKEGIEFQIINFTSALETLGQFDFVWLRFVLEYFLKEAQDIIRNLVSILRKDGVICLLDLDHNCLNHFPLPDNMESVLKQLIERMTTDYNFDPYAGRKLYTYLHDLGFRNIRVNMMAHHLIYNQLDSRDEFNWFKKIEMASKRAADVFEEYPGGYDGFFKDFNAFFNDPRRFTYTPLIICTGNKPEA